MYKVNQKFTSNLLLDGDLSDALPFLETYDEDESAIDILPEEVMLLLYNLTLFRY